MEMMKYARRSTRFATSSEYCKERTLFVPGELMVELLSGLRVHSGKRRGPEAGHRSLPPDPTLISEKARNGRYWSRSGQSRDSPPEFQPFVLSGGGGLRPA